ncbi:hypothetical protein [Acaryochloris sp. 'Moss Beach']
MRTTWANVLRVFTSSIVLV